MRLILLPIHALLLSGCEGFNDPGWILKGVAIEEDSTLHYVDVVGTITLNRNFSYSSGAEATAKFYSDEYNTLIDTSNWYIGEDLEEEGEKQEFSVGSIEVWMLPSWEGYSKVCVEFSAEDTNYEPPVERLGCITASDDSSG